MTVTAYRPSFVSLVAAQRSETPLTLHYQQPGLMRTPGGDLLIYTSLDDNPTSSETVSSGTEGRILRSEDNGLTWSAQADMTAYALVCWANGSDMYLFTMPTAYDSISIRKSTDDGATWGSPTELLTKASGFNWYCTMPGPLITGGRIYMPVYNTPDITGFFCKNTEMHVLHASTSADLTLLASWTLSNGVAVTGEVGEYGIWEPTALLDESSVPRIVCRFSSNQWTLDECGLVTITPGVSASVALDGLFAMSGGHSYFTVNRDPVTNDFLALVTRNTVGGGTQATWSQRTVVSLLRSASIEGPWTLVSDVVRSPNFGDAYRYTEEGYQYTNWIFDGDDIIASIRTAELGVAINFHQANALIFMRIKNYYANLLAPAPTNSGVSPSGPAAVTRNGQAV